MDPTVASEIVAAPVVVCDFDGTLAWLTVDWPALRADLRRIIVDAGHPVESDRLDAMIRATRERDEALFARLCARTAEAEIAGFSPARVRHPLLDALAARRGPWAICSANTREALLFAVATPPFSRCAPALVVGKEDVARGKPDPEGLRRIAAHFGVGASDMLFIGDSDDDARAGAAFGVTTRILER